MSDRSSFSGGRREFLERLRGEWPEGTKFVCGYVRMSPPGVDRVFHHNGTTFADVPHDRIRQRYSVPPGGRDADVGTVLVVEPDLDVEVRRTKPADLLTGPILPRLKRLAHATRCYMWWTRTPYHLPPSDPPWLGPD